jgi:predicted nucleic acid-binding Zn ribbon protein
MKDEPLRDCPVCSEPQAKRQISAGAGFILKGGGWYSDLYGSPGSKKSTQPPNGHGASDSKSDKAESTSTSTDATKKEPSKGTSAGT